MSAAPRTPESIPAPSAPAEITVPLRDVLKMQDAAHALFVPQQALAALADLLAPATSAAEWVDREKLTALVDVLAQRLQADVARLCDAGDALHR